MPRPTEYNKYTHQDIYNIIASYETTGNFGVTAKELGFPEISVRDIYYRNYEKDEFIEFRHKKRAEFNDKASKIIEQALNRLTKELETQDKIPVNSLSTVIGTLHDKINNVGSEIKVVGTPDIEVKVVDNSSLEKVMYDEKN